MIDPRSLSLAFSPVLMDAIIICVIDMIFVYRVDINDWPKVFLNCDSILGPTIFYAYGGLTKGGPFDKIFFLCFWVHLRGHYRLSSQKVVFLVKYHFRAFRSELEIKVGWNMKISGNFLSKEHKNIFLLLN